MALRPGRLEATRPPPDEPWVFLTLNLISSQSWRTLSIHARRVLDFLMIEQLKHAGKMNGKLIAPHRQLRAFGVGPQYIKGAIDELEYVGLVRVKRGGKKGTVLSETSTFRLTWLATWETEGKFNIPIPPTNDWQKASSEDEDSDFDGNA